MRRWKDGDTAAARAKEEHERLAALLGRSRLAPRWGITAHAADLLEQLNLDPEDMLAAAEGENLVAVLDERNAEQRELGAAVHEAMGETAELRIERRLWRCGLMEGHADVWTALDALLDRLEDHALAAQFRNA